MTEWIFRWFDPGNPPSGGSRDWMLQGEGINAGWAFLVFLVLAAACFWAYQLYAHRLSRSRRILLIALRLIAVAVLLILLVRPVLHLTRHEPVRQALLVLVDTSQSMLLADQRADSADLNRAALAVGLIDPAGGVGGAISGDAQKLAGIDRWALLRKLADNPKLDLWNRLSEKSDLFFYTFSSDLAPSGQVVAGAGTKPDGRGEALRLFDGTTPTGTATSLGDALRRVLELNRGLPVAGVLVVTDGANNSGIPPIEGARLARQQDVPLFLYGVGVSTPVDLVVQSLGSAQIGFVKEKTDVTARLRVQGLGQRRLTATLQANGRQVDTRTVDVRESGEYEVTFAYHPEEAGEVALEVSVPPVAGEVSRDNNTAASKIRIVDKKIQVLYIEQEPRWDFRYLLAYLQRDRRLDVRCVLIDGEPGLADFPDSPFLPALPNDRAEFFKQEILILGDVNPRDLGDNRMQWIREWVDQAHGGIIFLAGMKHNPLSYGQTLLEPVLPVVAAPGGGADRAAAPFKIQLTPTGGKSPYLSMDADPAESLRIWSAFPGVRWTAPVLRAKPGASVLLTDARPEKSVQGTPMPVMAVQGYGSGESVFIGTDETYRWRSRAGEKYYSRVWSSIMQSLSMKRLESASTRTQIKAARERYLVGDKVVISGKIYREDFSPATEPTIRGRLESATPDAKNKIQRRTTSLDLQSVTGQPGEYRAEWTASAPGKYSFSTPNDPGAKIAFEVVAPDQEKMESALNERLLRAMAEAAAGRFLREEDLHQLPDWIVEQGATVATLKKIELHHSPWWLLLLFLPLFAEWFLRRLWHMK